MQSPSFLEYQRQLRHRQGHDNAQTLFGIEPSPCDHQIRTLLDPMAPHYCNPVFFEGFAPLEQQRLLDPFRVLDQQLLGSLDGTQSFSSQALHCPHCLTRQLSHGQTLYSPTAITPLIVCPGRAQVIALGPAYSMPQDGHATQDCEQAAGKRWIQHHAATLVPPHVTWLGDALSSKEPFCSLALQPGFNFIVVCQPDSHPKGYKRLAFWQAQGAIAHRAQRCRHGRLTEVTR
jgi:hypothetical protein